MDPAWVKYQLRRYLCRNAIREDLYEELIYIDEDVTIRTSSLSDMPRSKGLPSSTVEREFERREDLRKKVYKQIDAFNRDCEQIAKALMELSDDEYTVISHLFFSVDFDEFELAVDMGTTASYIKKIRNKALRKLYNILCPDDLNERGRRLKRNRERVNEDDHDRDGDREMHQGLPEDYQGDGVTHGRLCAVR